MTIATLIRARRRTLRTLDTPTQVEQQASRRPEKAKRRGWLPTLDEIFAEQEANLNAINKWLTKSGLDNYGMSGRFRR
jgi:hypothetical protein